MDVKHRLWEGEKEKWREALTRVKRERILKYSSKEEAKLDRTYYRRKRNINYFFEGSVKRIQIRGRRWWMALRDVHQKSNAYETGTVGDNSGVNFCNDYDDQIDEYQISSDSRVIEF